MSVITCQNLRKEYPASFSGRLKKVALDDLSFSVNKNEVFGIVGPNGAGKSTVLKILLGFVRSDAGRAYLDDHPAYLCSGHDVLGYLPENPSLYRQLSVSEHLRFAARTAGMSASQTADRIEEIGRTVGLANSMKEPIRNFSKGMTQRAALAYALFLKPSILILDEPMSGLDPYGRQLVVDIIREYHAKGTTILLCSHILTDVERICTKIAVMNKGKLVAVTTPEELKNIKPDSTGSMTSLETYFFNQINATNQ